MPAASNARCAWPAASSAIDGFASAVSAELAPIGATTQEPDAFVAYAIRCSPASLIPNATWSVPSASRAIACAPVVASAESWVSVHAPGVPVASHAVWRATSFSSPGSDSP